MAEKRRRTELRYLLIGIVGAAAFVLFLIPAAIGILNEGNKLGLVVSALLLLYAVFHRAANRFFRFLWRYLAARIILRCALVFVSAAVLCALALSGLMIYTSHNAPEALETVIVLGCKVNGTEPSLTLEYRLKKAAQVLGEHAEAVAYVSGGQGVGEALPEAEAMQNYLVASGIDEARIIPEAASMNTEENIRFCADLIRETAPDDTVTIVSSDFHVLRAVILAQKNGIKAYSVGAPTPWYLFPTYYVRELLALAEELFLK